MPKALNQRLNPKMSDEVVHQIGEMPVRKWSHMKCKRRWDEDSGLHPQAEHVTVLNSAQCSNEQSKCGCGTRCYIYHDGDVHRWISQNPLCTIAWESSLVTCCASMHFFLPLDRRAHIIQHIISYPPNPSSSTPPGILRKATNFVQASLKSLNLALCLNFHGLGR